MRVWNPSAASVRHEHHVHTRPKPRRLAYIVTGIAMVLAASVLHATPASAANEGPFKFFNAHNNLCIDVAYGSLGNGARIQQWDCYGGPPEQWRRIHVAGGYYELKNVNSGKCLDVPWGSGTPGLALQQADCWRGDMQLWAVEGSYPGGDGVRIRNLMSNQCVSADTFYGRGASLRQQPCQLNDAQRWRMYPL